MKHFYFNPVKLHTNQFYMEARKRNMPEYTKYTINMVQYTVRRKRACQKRKWYVESRNAL